MLASLVASSRPPTAGKLIPSAVMRFPQIRRYEGAVCSAHCGPHVSLAQFYSASGNVLDPLRSVFALPPRCSAHVQQVQACLRGRLTLPSVVQDAWPYERSCGGHLSCALHTAVSLQMPHRFTSSSFVQHKMNRIFSSALTLCYSGFYIALQWQ